jgi:hypothetical protein
MASPEPLVTFARLPEYLRRSGRAFSASPAGDMIQVRYEDPQVSSMIAMRSVRTEAGTEWIALSVPLGPSANFKLRAALVANDDLPIGALADWQGLVLLRQTLPIRSLSVEQFEQVLHALAHTAGKIVAAGGYPYLVHA